MKKKTVALISVIIASIMFFNLFGKEENESSYDSMYQSMIRELQVLEWENFDAVKLLVQPAIEMIPVKASKSQLGNSRIGGTPDLPEAIEWPKFEEKPMVFFGQINFNELYSFHRNDLLPRNGILYFFAHFPEPENEFGAAYEYIKSKSEYKTIYFEGSIDQLRKTNFPNDLVDDYHFNSQDISFRTFFHLPPSPENAIIEFSSLSDHDKSVIDEYNDQFSDGLIDQILGIPVPLQTGVDFDWAIAELDLNLSEYESKIQEVNQVRSGFINLLTMPLFDRIGDSQAYWGIHLEHLKKMDFERTVFIMQGT